MKNLNIKARWSILRIMTAICIIVFCYASVANAYIGPGAGFAFVSSFFILFVVLQNKNAPAHLTKHVITTTRHIKRKTPNHNTYLRV